MTSMQAVVDYEQQAVQQPSPCATREVGGGDCAVNLPSLRKSAWSQVTLNQKLTTCVSGFGLGSVAYAIAGDLGTGRRK